MEFKKEKMQWEYKVICWFSAIWMLLSFLFVDNKCYVSKKDVFNFNFVRCWLLKIPTKKFPLPRIDLLILIIITIPVISLIVKEIKKIKFENLCEKIKNNFINDFMKNKKILGISCGIIIIIMILFILLYKYKIDILFIYIFALLLIMFIMMVIFGVKVFIKKFGMITFVMFVLLACYTQFDSWNFLNVKNMNISDLGNENSYKRFIVLRLVILLLEQLYVFVFLKFFSEKKITQVIRKRLLISITVIVLLYVLFNGFTFTIIGNERTEVSSNVFKNSRDVLSFGIAMKLLVSMIFYYIKDSMWNEKSELAD